jgi:RNA polymerase sigma-70 factor (ECF subfamily)
LLGLLGIVVAAAGPGRDLALLERIARRDGRALRALYEVHSSRALAVALRVLRDRADAEDVVQETFVEVWKRAAEYDPARGSAVAWLVTIARTRAIDRLRARASLARAEGAAANAQLELPAAAPEALEVVEQRRARERIAAALESLPAEQRRAIELAYYEGLTHREIAARTGDPLGTVKTRVRLGMEKLAALLQKEGRP